jgi:NADPH2:quinone reductase
MTSASSLRQVMEITGGAGVKAVIDGIGLATWEISLNCLARRGIFVTFGNAS